MILHIRGARMALCRVLEEVEDVFATCHEAMKSEGV